MNSILVAAAFAFGLGVILSSLALIMIITQVISEGFSVFTVTTGLLAVIVMGISYKGLQTTSKHLGKVG